MLYYIRSAEKKDASTVYHFICLLEETGLDQKIFDVIFKENISNKDYYYFVAESESGVITGFISCHVQSLLHHCGKVAEIQELFVEDKYRKYGIGRQLINYLEKKLLLEKVISFEVTAQNKRVQTHRFYNRLGFKGTHRKFVKQLV